MKASEGERTGAEPRESPRARAKARRRQPRPARAAADALYVEVLTANKNSLALMAKLMLPRGERHEGILGEELLEALPAGM